MEEYLLKRKGAPLWFQLTFIFIWVGGIVSLSVFSAGNQSDKEINSLMTPSMLRVGFLFQGILVFLLPIVFFLFLIRRDNLSYLRMNERMHPLALIAGFTLLLFAVPLVGWLGQLNSSMHLPTSLAHLEQWMKMREEQTAELTAILLNDKTIQGVILNVFIIGFVAAFTEELFFRSMLQQTLTEAKVNYHVAIWISAFVFSAIHLQFFGFIPRFVLGGLLGYLFYFTGNIWASILAHFINNSLIVVLSYFAAEDVNTNPLAKSADELEMNMSWPVVTASVALTIGVLYFLWKSKNKLREQSLTD
jgi:uncharacterized protein